MKLTWKKGKSKDGAYRLPENHRLRRDGVEIGVIMRDSVSGVWNGYLRTGKRIHGHPFVIQAKKDLEKLAREEQP